MTVPVAARPGAPRIFELLAAFLSERTGVVDLAQVTVSYVTGS